MTTDKPSFPHPAITHTDSLIHYLTKHLYTCIQTRFFNPPVPKPRSVHSSLHFISLHVFVIHIVIYSLMVKELGYANTNKYQSVFFTLLFLCLLSYTSFLIKQKKKKPQKNNLIQCK